MNILVLSDIESAGEWVATQNYLATLTATEPDINLSLVAFGKHTLWLQNNLFKHVTLFKNIKQDRQTRNIYFIIKKIRQCHQVLNQSRTPDFQPDLIICTEHFLGLSAKIIYPFVRTIYWFHNIRYREPSLLNKFEKLAWLVANQIIVPSFTGRSLLKTQLGIFFPLKQVMVMLNIVRSIVTPSYQIPFRLRRLSFHPKDIVILYAGRIAENKGLPNLIQAINQLKSTRLKLLIAYTNFNTDLKTMRQINKLVLKYRLRRRVIFLTNIKQSQIGAIYALAHLGILASDPKTEIYPMFLLEAINAGVPIISTENGLTDHWRHRTDIIQTISNNRPQTIKNALREFLYRPHNLQQSQHKKLLQALQQEKQQNLKLLTGLIHPHDAK